MPPVGSLAVQRSLKSEDVTLGRRQTATPAPSRVRGGSRELEIPVSVLAVLHTVLPRLQGMVKRLVLVKYRRNNAF